MERDRVRCVPLAAVLAAAGFLFPPTAKAALERLSFEELTQRSKFVLTGEVVELQAYRAPYLGRGECIFTDVKIRVSRVFKGKLEEGEVTVQVLGGTLEESRQICFDSPRYRKGETVLVFLLEHNQHLWNTGWLQGKYTIEQDGATVRGSPRLPIATDHALDSIKRQVELFSQSQAGGGGGR